ncbi:MAG: carbon storage regulator [Candidatus Midichloriaceae bacterium]|jgi:carbon storage regulator
MLYLTRKKGESVIIHNDVKITIVDIGRNSIKLGIESPKSSSVLKKELYDVIMNENMEALFSFNDAEINLKDEEENFDKK